MALFLFLYRLKNRLKSFKKNEACYIEVDFMVGKNQKVALLVITDRATLHSCLHKLKNKQSDVASKAIIDIRNTIDYPLLTITFVFDKRFAKQTEVAEELRVKTYFNRPFSSHDKGMVEKKI